MERSPLFDKRALEAVNARLQKTGPADVKAFFDQEPYLHQLIAKVVSTTTAKIFEGRDLENDAEAEFFKVVAKNLQFACTKILLVTRGCYRDLAELLLEDQFKMPAKEPSGRKVKASRPPPPPKEDPDEDELVGDFSED